MAAPTPSPISFGTTPDGRQARLWRLSNAHGMTAEVTDLGACLVSLRVPDGRGGFVDVALGYDGAAGYANNEPHFGAPVGRCCNRIGGASFELGGTRHELAAVLRGNSLHSGPDLWHRRMWEPLAAERLERSSRLTLRLLSPAGDQGFPGALDMRVTYELTDADALAISYEGLPSESTLVNVTNHSYLNLNGHASGTALHHTLQVEANEYTECRDDLVPTGRLLPVAGTPLDLREPRTLEKGARALSATGGYDHNYALRGWKPGHEWVGELRHVATLVGDVSGVALDLSSDLPGMQLYTGNFIGGEVGKGGVTYHDHDAVCLETQFFPDAIHHPSFAQPVFGPERPFRSRTVMAFRAEGR